MKIFRLCLLLLLAALIPVRGALAVGMQCSGGAARLVAQAQPTGHAHGHHASGHGAGHHEVSAHHPAEDAVHGHAGAADKCNICAASCAVAGLVSESPTLAEPQRCATASFPRLHVPPASFVSDGQERPPRTI